MPRGLSGLLSLALMLLAGPAPAQEHPVLTVQTGGAAAGHPARVRAQGVLHDRALREALLSGLPLRFSLRVELWRQAFFDRLVHTERVDLAVMHDPLDEAFTLTDLEGEQRFSSLAAAEAALERALWSTHRPSGRGRFYYLAVLEVETLSLSDLEELQRWLRGEARPAVEGRRTVRAAVESGLRRAVVRIARLPTRRHEARSPSFALP